MRPERVHEAETALVTATLPAVDGERVPSSRREGWASSARVKAEPSGPAPRAQAWLPAC